MCVYIYIYIELHVCNKYIWTKVSLPTCLRNQENSHGVYRHIYYYTESCNRYTVHDDRRHEDKADGDRHNSEAAYFEKTDLKSTDRRRGNQRNII